jgi:glycosyltransferase involved in cell wall biosynthesis
MKQESMSPSPQITSLPSNTDPSAVALVTIAIPTFNRCALLRIALESALCQTHAAIEILVCDNASTDGTAQYLEGVTDSRVRHVRHASNVGLVGNWNACVEHATGQYMLVLSDDDRLAPNAIENLLQPMAQGASSSDLAFVYGQCEMHDASAGLTQLSRPAPKREDSAAYRRGYLLSERVNYPSATLFRTEEARALGSYGSGGTACPIDTALAFQLSARHPCVGFTGTVTTYYLMHPENLTSSISATEMVASVAALGDLAVELARRGAAVDGAAAKRTQRLAQVRTLNHMLGRALSTRTMTTRDTLASLWRHRGLFATPATWTTLARIFAKLALHLTGWGRVPSRSAAAATNEHGTP